MREISESIEELDKWGAYPQDRKWEISKELGGHYTAYAVAWDNDDDWAATATHYAGGRTLREALHLLCEELKTGGDDER